ncbi:MAG: phytoene/squalene synthase family protein [Saprospiraceae bacterium]|nr:phytoene/squalene synthase family protein [Saprospiraceae bacterium]
MNQMNFYNKTCDEMSVVLTHRYSTSFSLGIKLFDKKLRNPICSVYGFVRLADEIVDTFHHIDQAKYLERIKNETKEAIEKGFSLNTVLHSFAQTVREYNIEWNLIESFLHSMEMDLHFKTFNEEEYKKYIYGSAEVVGLFCLKIFCKNEKVNYNDLAPYAMKLGSAFQKINFLRDIKSDYKERGRIYFPGLNLDEFAIDKKIQIESDIEKDFQDGLKGITSLPNNCKSGVKLAYRYYYALFNKIKKVSPQELLAGRIRIVNARKFYILCKEMLRIS